MNARVSLAELVAANIHLHPSEAVAIVVELCRRQVRGELRGLPSAGAIRLSRDGGVSVEGPIATGGAGSVARMAQLLSDMLPGFDAAPQLRARGGLRIVIARALGTLDLPPYDTLEDFCQALDRFAALDLRAAVRGLVLAWEERTRTPRMPRAPLTISDVRRARRATGLTLEDIASVADVPATELRALEWGDLREWPRTAVGRDRIARYARAAGLDETLVLSVAWPLIDESMTIVDAVPVAAQALVPSRTRALVSIRKPRRAVAIDHRFWLAWGVTAVAVVMLAIALFATVQDRALRALPPPAASPIRATQAGVLTLPPVPIDGIEGSAPIVSSSSVADPPRSVTKRDTRVPRVKRASAPMSPPEKKSLLKRELFRIVFR